MKILSENPLIIAIVGFKGREGIYKEIKESEIPKKYRIEELGGAGAFNAYCFRSNTAGITSKKYFIKLDDILDFEPKKNNLLEQLNDENDMFNTNKVLNILKELNSEEKFIVSFDIKNDKYTMTISRTLSENEIQVKEHKFEKYADDFKNLYRFEIRIPFDTLTKENVLELKENLEVLHELEKIYKSIYDRGYTAKSAKLLARFDLPAGYDMSTNANLLIVKQKALEREKGWLDFCRDEYKLMKKQDDEIKSIAKKEKFYKPEVYERWFNK